MDKVWSEVFTKSKLASNVFHIKSGYSGEVYDTLFGKFERLETSFETGSPVNASTLEWYMPFLDGGFVRYTGNFFGGARGSFIVGFRAFRAVCRIMDITPPIRVLRDEQDFVSPDQLITEIGIEAAQDMTIIEKRQDELYKRFASLRF